MIPRAMITLLITISIAVPTPPCTSTMRTMLTRLTVIPALLAKRETSGSSAYEASAGASSVCVHMIVCAVDAWRERAARRGAVLDTCRSIGRSSRLLGPDCDELLGRESGRRFNVAGRISAQEVTMSKYLLPLYVLTLILLAGCVRVQEVEDGREHRLARDLLVER